MAGTKKRSAELLGWISCMGRVKMDWLILAFLGTIFFSGAGVLDKLLLSNCTNDFTAYIVCQTLIQQLFIIPVLLFAEIDFTYPGSLIALLFGCMQIFPTFFYMKALQAEEVSKVSALECVYPVFIFMGSIILFGEMLDLKCCAGGAMLILGTFILSYKRGGSLHNTDSRYAKMLKGITSVSPTIKLFMAYWILTAIYYLALKYLLNSMDEWNFHVWSSIGTLLVIMPLMSRQSIRTEVKNIFGRGSFSVAALISEEALQFLGQIFSLFAYAIGSVTLVSSVGALQPVLTVILIMTLGVLAPKLARGLNERTDRESLAQKGVAFLVVLIGIYFVG